MLLSQVATIITMTLWLRKTTITQNNHSSWGPCSSMSWMIAEALVHSKDLSSFASATEAFHPIAATSPAQPPLEPDHWGKHFFFNSFFQVWTSQVFRTCTGEGQHISLVDDHYVEICVCSEGPGNPTTHCGSSTQYRWWWTMQGAKWTFLSHVVCVYEAGKQCSSLPQKLFKWDEHVSFPACPAPCAFLKYQR